MTDFATIYLTGLLFAAVLAQMDLRFFDRASAVDVLVLVLAWPLTGVLLVAWMIWRKV